MKPSRLALWITVAYVRFMPLVGGPSRVVVGHLAAVSWAPFDFF